MTPRHLVLSPPITLSAGLSHLLHSRLVMETERGEWGNHCEYFLTALGFAVGLGNVWRFPYVAYNNGGGTFLIPYFICLLLLGIPLFFMEMVLGQYTGVSCTKVKHKQKMSSIYRQSHPQIFPRLVPGLPGLGYGIMAIPVMIAFYYTVIMAWGFYFMFQVGWGKWTRRGICSDKQNCHNNLSGDEDDAAMGQLRN